MHHALFLGLGSNQGNKIQNCERAIIEILKRDSHQLVSRSSWYQTQPWGKENQAWFINGVVQIMTVLPPEEVLEECKRIEFRLGRTDPGHWQPRMIDIDILFYDDLVIQTPDCEIPHPRIHLRNFVLVPLAEIAPQFFHPVFNKSIEGLLKESPDKKLVRKLEDNRL
ncbi:MAG: 2-amino-4-hydroxy-6-hydroxymethyldihydropteridine diphosphokinase [Deltaproteobacteria bacterium]|nr:2-amino-4-hydroxy-6-hydroxymethyldihydropteridine diphosphokinase [Deltaproteobacteria bacterium]